MGLHAPPSVSCVNKDNAQCVGCEHARVASWLPAGAFGGEGEEETNQTKVLAAQGCLNHGAALRCS